MNKADATWQDYERLVESTKRCEACGRLPDEPPGPECVSDEGMKREREGLWARVRKWWQGRAVSDALDEGR